MNLAKFFKFSFEKLLIETFLSLENLKLLMHIYI